MYIYTYKKKSCTMLMFVYHSAYMFYIFDKDQPVVDLRGRRCGIADHRLLFIHLHWLMLTLPAEVIISPWVLIN